VAGEMVGWMILGGEMDIWIRLMMGRMMRDRLEMGLWRGGRRNGWRVGMDGKFGDGSGDMEGRMWIGWMGLTGW